jgi:hypothetical protein
MRFANVCSILLQCGEAETLRYLLELVGTVPAPSCWCSLDDRHAHDTHDTHRAVGEGLHARDSDHDQVQELAAAATNATRQQPPVLQMREVVFIKFTGLASLRQVDRKERGKRER